MSSSSLKILAMITMFIDHIGFGLFPQYTILRIIGRIAFPIFAFQVATGFLHTKNKEKYIIRMLIFTIISQIPFYIFNKTAGLAESMIKLNVGATLTFGLLSLYTIEKIKHPVIKFSMLFLLFELSLVVPMDYGWLGVLSITFFYIFKDSKILKSMVFSALLLFYSYINANLISLYALLALIPINLYNGTKGKDAKYLFYAFYPLHMLLIALFSYFN